MRFILILCLILPSIANAATSWSTGTYSNNQDISKTLLIPGAKIIEVNIIGRTENCCDFVQIFNAQTNEFIKNLQGEINETFTVKSRSIRVRLKTDSSVTDSGITVSISKVNNNEDNITIKDVPTVMRSKGWSLAARLMEYWFEGTGENYFVDMSEITNISTKLSNELNELNRKAQDYELVDKDFKKYLITELKKTPNGRGGTVIPDGGAFNHIDSEISLTENTWHDLDWEKKKLHYVKEIKVNSAINELSEYTAAFERAVIRVVASGEVIVNNNIATVNVLEVGVYFRDTYDFVDDDEDLINWAFGSQPLGCWSKKTPYISPFRISLDEPNICIFNSMYRDYNRGRGYDEKRGDFLIFTRPKDYVLYTNESFEHELGNKNQPLTYIDECINKFQNYFGSKKESIYSCSDNEGNQYFCQNTTGGSSGSATLIAISKELRGFEFIYYLNGWGNQSLITCK